MAQWSRGITDASFNELEAARIERERRRFWRAIATGIESLEEATMPLRTKSPTRPPETEEQVLQAYRIAEGMARAIHSYHTKKYL